MNKKETFKILLIDNYDSFSFNIVKLLRPFPNIDLHIKKNDEEGLCDLSFDAVIISPGPGLPEEAGHLNKALAFYHKRIPIFGICLGLQAIVNLYGGGLLQLPTVFHGIRDTIQLLDERSESPIFRKIPPSFFAGRYHSWVGAQKNLPKELRVTATGSDGSIMALENIEDGVFAVQFHPESYMTEYGDIMLQNFIHLLCRNEEIQAISLDAK